MTFDKSAFRAGARPSGCDLGESPPRTAPQTRTRASHRSSARTSEETRWTPASEFTGRRAMYINSTLNRSSARSHTQGLTDRSVALIQRNAVEVDQIRTVDHYVAVGVQPDHDRVQMGPRRVACPTPAHPRRRHPGARRPDLARRQQLGDAADHRTALRVLRGPQLASTPTTSRSAAACSPETKTASSTAQ